MPSVIKEKLIHKLFKEGYSYEEAVAIISLFDEVMQELIDTSTEQ